MAFVHSLTFPNLTEDSWTTPMWASSIFVEPSSSSDLYIQNTEASTAPPSVRPKSQGAGEAEAGFELKVSEFPSAALGRWQLAQSSLRCLQGIRVGWRPGPPRLAHRERFRSILQGSSSIYFFSSKTRLITGLRTSCR